MSDFNYVRNYGGYNSASAVEVQNTLLRKSYLWMASALVLTGLTSYFVANSPGMLQLIFGSRAVFYGLIIAELALVIGLTSTIQRISVVTATLLFVLYSVLNGALLASIFHIFTTASIATTFFVTAGTFGVMALYGSIRQYTADGAHRTHHSSCGEHLP